MSVPSPSTILLVFALTAADAASAAGPPLTPGVDCACAKVGDYVLPTAPVPALPANGITGSSPGGRFNVAAVAGSLQAAAITVTRNLDDAVLLNHLEAADWGFSPDDERLVVATKAVNGSPATVALYDLTTVPASKLREITPAAAGSAASFSPHGRWFADVELSPSPSNVTLVVYDAFTGALVYQDSFPFSNAPGLPEDVLGAVAVGFGPDPGDRTLTYAYLTSATTSQWTAVDLEAPLPTVVDQQPGPAFVWGFSPCGDVIGLIADHTANGLKSTLLFATLARATALPPSVTFPSTDVASLSVDATNHRVQHAATVVALASNTAAAACPPPPANAPPTASFTAPVTTLSLLPVQFTDLSSDSDGRVVAWAWDFGDGTASSLRSPTHPFTLPGRYTVKLTVTDDGGATGSVSHAIDVSTNQPPVAAFTVSPASPAARDVVTLTDRSTDDDGVVSRAWNVDGLPFTGTVVEAKACPPSMRVTLDVTDHAGQAGEATQEIAVSGSSGDIPVPAGADLNAAIAAACPGDRLVLEPGHYTGGATVPPQITIKGAGRGATFIDGAGTNPDHFVLTVLPGATVSDLKVSGGGIATAPPVGQFRSAGGGILVTNPFGSGPKGAATATLSNLEVTANLGNGAIAVDDQIQGVVLSGSSIHGNETVVGGSAAFAMGCCASVRIERTEVFANTGPIAIAVDEANSLEFVQNDVHDNLGSGLVTDVSPGQLQSFIVLSRFANNGGVGLSSDGSVLHAGNLIVNNRGGGVASGHPNQFSLYDSTVADNGGLGVQAAMTLYNTIVTGNATDLGGAVQGSSNLIGANAGFVGGGDYHLAPGSPAIDRGDDAKVPTLLTTDGDGDNRGLNAGSGAATVDIGWDEAVTGWQASPDAGSPDAGRADAGAPDAGPRDAGSADAGSTSDAGPGGTGGTRGGCGCQSSSPGAGAWLFGAALLLARRKCRATAARCCAQSGAGLGAASKERSEHEVPDLLGAPAGDQNVSRRSRCAWRR